MLSSIVVHICYYRAIEYTITSTIYRDRFVDTPYYKQYYKLVLYKIICVIERAVEVESE